MVEVVTIGETMVLIDPVQTGPWRYVTNFTKSIGGAETNLAIALCRLGHQTGWISRLGDEELGRYVYNFLRGEGLDVSQVIFDPDAPTGLFFKERRIGAESRVFYYRKFSAASRLQPSDLNVDYIRQAKYLHISGITPALSDSARATVFRAFEIARAHNVQISFDPNIRLKLWTLEQARPVLNQLAQLCDIYFPGQKEINQLYPDQTPDEVAAMLLEKGVKKVALKLGEKGCRIYTPEHTLNVPGFPVNMIDPIGAGDGFAAGFLAGQLRGLNDEESGRLGNAVGATAVTVTGDVEGYPTHSEVMAFLGKTTLIER